jgi:hypothetical protein
MAWRRRRDARPRRPRTWGCSGVDTDVARARIGRRPPARPRRSRARDADPVSSSSSYVCRPSHTHTKSARPLERGPVRFSRRRGPTRDPCCAAARARTPAPVTSPRPGWCDQPATRAMSGQGPALPAPRAAAGIGSAPRLVCKRRALSSGARPAPEGPRAVVRMPGPRRGGRPRKRVRGTRTPSCGRSARSPAISASCPQ